jgi:L-ribulose-5-phosphate 4-epimerase
MLENLRKAVCAANIKLFTEGIVFRTWGNVSGIDRETNLVVIKPSGVSYEEMTAEDMVIVNLNGKIVEGKKPSVDTPTHLEIYKAFPQIGGIAHTHSTYATAFAQVGLPIVPLGTTHADYFYGEIPCTRILEKKEVETDYEENTGKVIIETLREPFAAPAVLVNGHAPFTFGESAEHAAENAVLLEQVAKIAAHTLSLNSSSRLPQYIIEKHYNRKHGKEAYYGQ